MAEKIQLPSQLSIENLDISRFLMLSACLLLPRFPFWARQGQCRHALTWHMLHVMHHMCLAESFCRTLKLLID